MDFRPLTRIIFGSGRLQSLGELAEELGFRRTLVVSDPGIRTAGHVDCALESLREAGVEILLFDGVEENPTTVHVEKGLEAARRFRIDSLVGLGGGSSMDCAKGVNFLYTNGETVRDYWGYGKASRPLLPMIAVPTTAGTGSETQSFALISDPETHQKMACGDKKLTPAVALLDPTVTLTLPYSVTAVSGLDAISHAVESFVTKQKTPFSRGFSREAWILLSSSFERVLGNPGDVEARGCMLLGASLAGLAIENSMLGATHSLANPLTARFGVSHGVAIGLMLPHVVRFNSPSCESEYGELVALTPGSSNLKCGGEQLAERIESFRSTAGLPIRLSQCGVSENSLRELSEEASQQWTAQFNPRPVSVQDMEALYRCAL